MRGGHTGLRVMATNVAAVGVSTQEAPQTKNGKHAAQGSLTVTVGVNGYTLLGDGTVIWPEQVRKPKERCKEHPFTLTPPNQTVEN